MRQPPRGNRRTQRRMPKMASGNDPGARQRQSSQSSLLLGLGIAAGVICLALLIFIVSKPAKRHPIKKAHVGKYQQSRGQRNEKSDFLNETAENSDDKQNSGAVEENADDDSNSDNADSDDTVSENSDGRLEEPIEEPIDDDDDTSKTGIDLQQELATINRLPEYERVDRYLELASRCEDAGLDRNSRERVYSKVIELDPDNQEALEWLGYVRKIGGKWITAQEAPNYGLYNYQGAWLTSDELRSRKLILHDGKWLTKEEVAKLKAVADAKQEPEDSLPWLKTIEEACAKAKEKKTAVFAVVKTKNCHWCRELEKNTLNHVSFKKYAKKFALVKIDGNENKEFCRKYKISGFPTMLILDDKQRELKRITGYIEAGPLVLVLKKMLNKATSGNLRPTGTKRRGSKSAPELKGMTAIFNDDGRASLAAHRGDLLLVEVYLTT